MLTGFDYFDDLLQLRNVVDRFFRDSSLRQSADYPLVNLHDSEDSVTVKAIIPGVQADTLDIQLVNNSLIIEGERKIDHEDRPYVRRERDFGTFRKSIAMPYRVERDSITAKINNGILTVTLKKSEDAKPKKITIN